METTEDTAAVVPVAPKKDWRHRSRKKYDLEFKQQVIKEYAAGGISAKALAKKHKITSDTAVHNWVRTLGGMSRREAAKSAKVTLKSSKVPSGSKPPVTVEKTEGRIDLYVKSDRAMLLQVIGEQYLEIRRLEAKKPA